MTSTPTAVAILKEGDVIEGVGTVTGVVHMASGLVVDVVLPALDGKMASIAWEPTYRDGWEWPLVNVVN